MLFLVYFSYLSDQSFCKGWKRSWRRWSCWHLAKMSVTLRSLSRVWTSWIARCIRKPQTSKRWVTRTAGRPTTYTKRETLNAPHTHVWRTCAYVDWVTSCHYLPSLSLAIRHAAILSPSQHPSPQKNSQIKYNITQIYGVFIYLCHHRHNFPPAPYRRSANFT